MAMQVELESRVRSKQELWAVVLEVAGKRRFAQPRTKLVDLSRKPKWIKNLDSNQTWQSARSYRSEEAPIALGYGLLCGDTECGHVRGGVVPVRANARLLPFTCLSCPTSDRGPPFYDIRL